MISVTKIFLFILSQFDEIIYGKHLVRIEHYDYKCFQDWVLQQFQVVQK